MTINDSIESRMTVSALSAGDPCTDAAKWNPWHRNVTCGDGGFRCSVAVPIGLGRIVLPSIHFIPGSLTY